MDVGSKSPQPINPNPSQPVDTTDADKTKPADATKQKSGGDDCSANPSKPPCLPPNTIGGVSYKEIAQNMPQTPVAAPVPVDSPYFGLPSDDLAKRRAELEQSLSSPTSYVGRDKEEKELRDILAIQAYRKAQTMFPPRPCVVQAVGDTWGPFALGYAKVDTCHGVDITVSVVHGQITLKDGNRTSAVTLDAGSVHVAATGGEGGGPDGSDGAYLGATATALGVEATYTPGGPYGQSRTAGASVGSGYEGGVGIKTMKSDQTTTTTTCVRGVGGPATVGGCEVTSQESR